MKNEFLEEYLLQKSLEKQAAGLPDFSGAPRIRTPGSGAPRIPSPQVQAPKPDARPSVEQPTSTQKPDGNDFGSDIDLSEKPEESKPPQEESKPPQEESKPPEAQKPSNQPRVLAPKDFVNIYKKAIIRTGNLYSYCYSLSNRTILFFHDSFKAIEADGDLQKLVANVKNTFDTLDKDALLAIENTIAKFENSAFKANAPQKFLAAKEHLSKFKGAIETNSLTKEQIIIYLNKNAELTADFIKYLKAYTDEQFSLVQGKNKSFSENYDTLVKNTTTPKETIDEMGQLVSESAKYLKELSDASKVYERILKDINEKYPLGKSAETQAKPPEPTPQTSSANPSATPTETTNSPSRKKPTSENNTTQTNTTSQSTTQNVVSKEVVDERIERYTQIIRNEVGGAELSSLDQLAISELANKADDAKASELSALAEKIKAKNKQNPTTRTTENNTNTSGSTSRQQPATVSDEVVQQRVVQYTEQLENTIGRQLDPIDIARVQDGAREVDGLSPKELRSISDSAIKRNEAESRRMSDEQIEIELEEFRKNVKNTTGKNPTENQMLQAREILDSGRDVRSSRSELRNLVSEVDASSKNTWSRKFKDGLKNQISRAGTAAFGVAGSIFAFGAKSLLGVAVLIGLYYLLFSKRDDAQNLEAKKQLMAALDDSTLKANRAATALESLKFKDNSAGQDRTQKLIEAMNRAQYFNKNFKDALDKKEYSQLDLEDYDKSMAAIIQIAENYIADSEVIKQDLESGDFDAALKEVIEFKRHAENELTQAILNVINQIPEDGLNSVRDVLFEPNNYRPRVEGQQNFQSVKAKVWKGTPAQFEVEIGNKNEEWRNAFYQIVSTIFSTPAGRAFLDPNGIWGGGMDQARSGNLEVDILQAANELINHKVYTYPRFIRYMKQKFDPKARRDTSGFKKAIRYYEANHVQIPQRQTLPEGSSVVVESSLNNNFEKRSKNLHKILSSNDNSIIFSNQSMKKQAEYNSDEYFDSVLKGLKDKYSKTYLKTLKEHYNHAPEKRSADESELYHTNKESGSEFINNAHPHSVNLADAMGDGGTIHNSIGKQNKTIDIMFSVPSGNFLNRHASILNLFNKTGKTKAK